jgi:hypothetical protein
VGELVRRYGPAVLAWVVLVVLRPSPAPGRALVRVCVLGLAVSQTALTPAFDRALRALGFEDTERLIGHLGMLLAVWAGTQVVLRLHDRDAGARLLTAWSVAAGVAMCALFAATPNLFPESPWVMEYCIAYALAQYPGFAVTAVLCLRQARRAPDRVLRVGLALVAAGVLAAMCYITIKTVVAISFRAEFSFSFGREYAMSKALPTVAHLLVLGGVVVPAVASWVRRRAQYRRLAPLWLALYRAAPEIALEPPRRRIPVFPTRLALYRQVVEIRDGLLLLRPYRSADVVDAARDRAADSGLRDERLETAVEAATVAAALDAHERDAPPSRPDDAVTGGRDLTSDIEYLCRLADAFREQPLAAAPA